MDAQITHLRQLTATFKENLTLCAKDASVDAVHDVRTGTRRLEALLDTILRSARPVSRANQPAASMRPGNPRPSPLEDAAERWLRLLKRIRRTAAPVRDLDVHRKLLEKLAGRPIKADIPAESPSQPSGDLIPQPDASQAPPAEQKLSADQRLAALIERQADDLDAWLKHTREDNARALVKNAGKWASKLDGHLASVEQALCSRLTRRASRPAAVVALEAFARLAAHMQQLDAGNLHDFRKGAKKARYMAEADGDEEHAGMVGKALKKLQDEIGDWHDWMVLAEEAERALGDHGLELTARIEQQRDEHFITAMKTTERMRGRLLGEWQAATVRRRPVHVRPRTRRPPSAAS
jgi:CHAD domain-containing protein